MHWYLKKSTRLFPLLVVMVCAALAASAVSQFLDAAMQPDEDNAAGGVAYARPMHPMVGQPPSKDGSRLVERNMFCSSCQREQAPAAIETAPATGDPPTTDLPLQLIATLVSSDSRSSVATVGNAQGNRQGAYRVGGDIPGAGPVVLVQARFIDFENRRRGRVERLPLFRELAESRPAQAPSPSTAKQAAQGLEGIRKLSDTEYAIDRSVVGRVLANPLAMAGGARVSWTSDKGVPSGFKLFAVRPGSALAAIGLRNGDAVRAVNGMQITGMDKALEVVTKVRESSNLSLTITRNGQPVELRYRIQ